ncbi:hypothetical protein Btru_074054 [Bulinus truncatus]|nr:hypothetical protein Btru_074054 [Bulinus truncatus]
MTMESPNRPYWVTTVRWRGSQNMESLNNRPAFESEVNNNQVHSAQSEQIQEVDGSATQRNTNELVKDMLLLAAVQEGIERLKVVLESSLKKEAEDLNGNTSSPYSSQLDFQDLVVKCGAHPANMNVLERSFQALSKIQDCADMVPSLIARGANVNCVNVNLDSPLILACGRGDIINAKILLDAGADVEYAGKDGDTSLIRAARYGYIDIVQLLLESGAAIDAENSRGDTALLCAAQYNRVKAVKYLLQEGADVNHANKTRDTALMLAVCKRSIDVCKSLVLAGVEINAVDCHGNSALINAARLDQAHILKFLIESGACLDQVSLHNYSALWFAVCHSVVSYSPCLGLLLKSGPRITFELHQAVSVGLLHVVKELLEYGAVPCEIDITKLNIRSFPEHIHRVSPLYVSILTQRLDIATYFIAIGFLTNHDLQCLPYDDRLRRFLKDNAKTESLYFMNTTLAQPWSLERLCLIIISKSIGFRSHSRAMKVKGTGLPLVYQRSLLS